MIPRSNPNRWVIGFAKITAAEPVIEKTIKMIINCRCEFIPQRCMNLWAKFVFAFFV